jgi:hypothetical protein
MAISNPLLFFAEHSAQLFFVFDLEQDNFKVVLFEKDLTVYLGQEGNSEVKEIHINS